MSKFDIKDKLDEVVYSAYNFFSDVLFGLNFEAKKLVRENYKYKGIHAGERCFVLATGPSLNKLSDGQVGALKSEYLFGVNSLYKADVASKLTPRYYALMDNLYWGDWSHTFEEVVERYRESPPVIITDLRAKHIVEELSGKVSSLYVYSKKYPTKEMSSEITGNIYAAMNVVAYSILVAMYMGFKEIYLLGCDYNAFCSAGVGHCYDDKKELGGFSYNLAFYLKFYWITTEFHYLIADLARKQGVEVVNLTEGSLLDAYPRKDISIVL